jgi:hypothetical protein
MPYVVSDDAVQAVNSNIKHVDDELFEVDNHMKLLNKDIDLLNSHLSTDIWLVALSLVMLLALIVMDGYKMRMKYLKKQQKLAGASCMEKDYSENLV